MRSHDIPRRESLLNRWGAPATALLLLVGAGMSAVVLRFWPDPPPASADAPEASPGSPAPSTSSPRRAAVQRVPSPGPLAGSSDVVPPRAVPAVGAEVVPAPSSPASSPELPAARREAIRAVARTYREGRFNAFFRESTVLEELRQGGRENIVALQEELADVSALAALPAETRIVENRPEAVLDRMAMIDLLHTLAPEDASAREAMVALALTPVDPTLPDMAKKNLVGEKYDLLFRLAQLDRQRAVNTFARLESDALKRLLRNALLTGLYESGATADEVERLTQRL